MNITDKVAVITGAASGLGQATAEAIIAKGGKVMILDRDDKRGPEVAAELGANAAFVQTDVTDEESVKAAIDATVEKFGAIHVCVNCAGVGSAMKTVGRENKPHDLGVFNMVVKINLIGTFNVIRLAAAQMAENTPNETGERGVIINTASIAAYDGQIGQCAYSASKGGVVGMTLPIARDLSRTGIRVVTIAPGLFATPMLMGLPEPARDALGASIPFPSRLGDPTEYGQLACQIVENPMLNGEVIRLDGALRMAPK